MSFRSRLRPEQNGEFTAQNWSFTFVLNLRVLKPSDRIGGANPGFSSTDIKLAMAHDNRDPL